MKFTTACLVAACMLIGVSSANAQAVISSTDGTNTVYLGVDLLGQLNVSGGPVTNASATGIAYSGPGVTGVLDATSPGCLCEGWGVSLSATTQGFGTVSGFANNSSGTAGLSSVSFASTATTATSTVRLTGTSPTGGGGVTVEQAYSEFAGAVGALFENKVTITNSTSDAVADLKYVRVMDWDVPPTEFDEHVSMVGATAAIADGVLEYSDDNGFDTADPLSASDSPIVGGTASTDFTDVGPEDHGAYFRFDLTELLDATGGLLEAGDSLEFSVFYGAAPSEAEMLAALAAAGIELYTLGQSSAPSGDPVAGTPITYAFGFGGLNLTPVIPDVPEPTTIAVWGILATLGGTVSVRRRQRA